MTAAPPGPHASSAAPAANQQSQVTNPSQEFDRAFGEIARSYMESKAPTLMTYLDSFHILDKSDDDQRAVGVFVFRLGDSTRGDSGSQNVVLAPVFFLHGELKGHELMLSVSDNMFVPLAENWIHSLIARKPYLLGESTELSPAEIGRSSPQLHTFYQSPMRSAKYASMVAEPPPVLPDLDLGQVLPKLGEAAFLKLCSWADKSTAFANTLYRFYPPERLAEIGDQLRKIALQYGVRTDDAPDYAKVRIVDSGDSSDAYLLDEMSKEQLAKGQMVIVDNRDDKKLTKVVALTPKQYHNPTQTGIYDVVNRRGEIITAFVFCSARAVGYSDARFVTVVERDSQAAACVLPKDVWAVRDRHAEMKEAFNKLPPADEMTVGDVCVLLTPAYDSCTPFKVRDKLIRADGQIEYVVDPVVVIEPSDSYITRSLYRSSWGTPASPKQIVMYDEFSGADPGSLARRDYADSVPSSVRPTPDSNTSFVGDVGLSFANYRSLGNGVSIVLTDKPVTHFSSVGSTLVVPTQCRVLKLRSRLKNFAGDMQAAINLITKHDHSVNQAVKVAADKTACEYSVTTVLGTTAPMSAKQAAVYLTSRLGFSGTDAMQLLRDSTRHGQSRVHVSYGEGYPHVGQIKSAVPRFPNVGLELAGAYDDSLNEGVQSRTGIVEQYPTNQSIPLVPSSQPDYDRTDPLQPLDYRSLMSAGQTGDKPLFDVTTLGVLLRTSDIEGMVDTYLPKLRLALDHVGRLLFALYWHADEFKERYGSTELPDLEASLRNVFKGLGDLVLFLQQRTMRDPMSLRAVELDDPD